MTDVRPIDLLEGRLIRRYPVRPMYVTAALLDITRRYFVRGEYLVTERFRSKHNHSVTSSPENHIVIESPMSWPVEYAEKRPAIFIRRLEWQLRRLGLADGRIVGTRTILDESAFSWFWRGFHAFYVLSREGGELELLIEELINLLLRYTPVIRKLFGFIKFQLVSVGRPQAYIAATDMFTSQLIVRYEWTETWKTYPKFEDIEESINLAIPE
ncbi:MAG: hypothetical protein QXQ37_04090 [Nitrososphaerota archaeon]